MKRVVYEICPYCNNEIEGTFDDERQSLQCRCPTCKKLVILCSLCKDHCDRSSNMQCHRCKDFAFANQDHEVVAGYADRDRYMGGSNYLGGSHPCSWKKKHSYPGEKSLTN